MKFKYAPVTLVLLAGLTVACTLSPMVTPPPPRNPTATPEPVQPATQAAPTLTSTPYRTPTPSQPVPTLPTTTPPPPAFSASVAVLSIQLRSGPSTIHPVIGRLQQGNLVSLLGRAAGDEWILVETTRQGQGWLYAAYMDLEGDMTDLPEVQVMDAHQVRGGVFDRDGTPINGVVFAIYQEQGSETLRTDARSGQNGRFYAYLPMDAEGRWTVAVVGVDCGSWITDTNCRYLGTFLKNGIENINLPDPKELYFLYETGR